MYNNSVRKWLICWMYLLSFGHFAAGILLAWFANTHVFDHYHNSILGQINDFSVTALQLQKCWVSLFGATLQNLAIFMGILTYMASKQRSGLVWGWMIIALVVWAPQDMFISLQIDLWLHVWVDLLALALMLPPLFILWWLDRAAV